LEALLLLANPEHVAKLLAGVDAWNKWREQQQEGVPDLSGASLPDAILDGADLRNADLENANLYRVSLFNADLRKANLTHADLRFATLAKALLNEASLVEADLTSASLGGCDLRGSNLIMARLNRADCVWADFREAGLLGTSFRGAILVGAKINAATLGDAEFSDCDLREVEGLEAVHHSRPSTIGIDTVYRSKGQIPEAFLRGCGVPDDFIAFSKSIAARKEEFYSCFISYSSKDSEFATQLHARLQARNVRCWKDSEDLKIGDRFQEEIETAIRAYDKLLVILSENSVNSPWVEREVQAAFEKERCQSRAVLFPIRLDDAVMDSQRAWAAEIRRVRHIGNFCNWKDEASFQSSLDRLIRDLKSHRLPAETQSSKSERSTSTEQVNADPKFQLLRDAFSRGAELRIEPLIGPDSDNRFNIIELSGLEMKVQKTSSDHQITIPLANIGEILREGREFTLAVGGRIQWITSKGFYKLLPSPPRDEMGVPKIGSPGASDVFALQQKLSQKGYYSQWNHQSDVTVGGYQIAYDDDGRYFRCEGRVMPGSVEILAAKK